jgi:hypothetical protein
MGHLADTEMKNWPLAGGAITPVLSKLRIARLKEPSEWTS